MPTYEFRCPNGHEFTRFYKTISGAQAQLPCPECNAVADRQLSGGAGLVFKGSGFYLTDYGKNAHRGGAKSSTASSDSSSSSSSGDKKSDAGGAKSDAAKPKADTPKADSPKPKAS